MPITAHGPTVTELPFGDVWEIHMRVTDADGYPAADVPVVTVTYPDASFSAATVETISTGDYRALVALSVLTGRHVARAVATNGVREFVAYAVAPTTNADLPDLADVKAYLGTTSWTDNEITAALAAETSAQRDRCRVPAAYSVSLREALFRRVARNLAMRQNPLAMPQGDASIGMAVLPGNDPEVRRLEAPHRKRVVG